MIGKAALFLPVIIGICICCGCIRSYTTAVRMNWGIDLPYTGAKEIFSYSVPDFHGDGIRYHVIDYSVGNGSKKAHTAACKLDTVFDGSSHPTATQTAYAEQLLKQIDVPENMFPDWKRCSLVCRKQEDNSELFLFRSRDTGTVYILESFV